MAVTARQFRAQFPEFRETPVAVIERALSDAYAQINSSVWGAKTDIGAKYLAAHIISSGPRGEQARLDKKKPETTYWETYNQMMFQVTSGFRAI